MKSSSRLFAGSVVLLIASLTAVTWIQRDLAHSKRPVPSATTDRLANTIVRPPTHLTAPTLDTDGVAIQTEMQNLREAIAILVENQSLTQDSLDRLDSLPRQASEASNEASLNPEQAAQEDQARMQNRFLALDNRLAQEATDTEWAGATLDRIENSLQNPELIGFTLTQSQCGSSLCKVEMALPPNQAQEEALQKMSAHRGWDGPTVFEVNEAGQAIFYIARNERDFID